MNKIIHKVGLLTNRRDKEVKEVIDSIYEFMKKEITEKDLDNDEETNFFHQHLGKFHFKKRVYERIQKTIKSKNKKDD